MKTVEVKGEIIPNDYAIYYDWFGKEYTCPANVKEVLNTLDDGEDLTVEIASGGGDVVSGQTVYSMLKKSVPSIIMAPIEIISAVTRISCFCKGVLFVFCFIFHSPSAQNQCQANIFPEFFVWFRHSSFR